MSEDQTIYDSLLSKCETDMGRAMVRFYKGQPGPVLSAIASHGLSLWMYKGMSPHMIRSLCDAGLFVAVEYKDGEFTAIPYRDGVWFIPTVKAVNLKKCQDDLLANDRLSFFGTDSLRPEDLAKVIATDPQTTDLYKSVALELLALRMAWEPYHGSKDTPEFIRSRVHVLEQKIATALNKVKIEE